jgi:TPR repeat protein
MKPQIVKPQIGALLLAAAPVAAQSVADGAQAAYRLGLAYRNGSCSDGNSNGNSEGSGGGHCVARDPALALRWLGRAAEGGVPAAMFILAHMLAEGEGTAPDAAAARRWLAAAAQAEYPEALQELAMEERDPVRAAELLREAAHAMQHRAHGR